MTLVTSAPVGALPPAVQGAAAHAAVVAALAAKGIRVLAGSTAVRVDEAARLLYVEPSAAAVGGAAPDPGQDRAAAARPHRWLRPKRGTGKRSMPVPLPPLPGLLLGAAHSPLRFDLLVTATGAAAQGWLETATDLPVDGDGFVRVGPTLQVPGAAAGGRVFSAGDCAAVDVGASGGHSGGVPKAGVFSVRQGPVL